MAGSEKTDGRAQGAGARAEAQAGADARHTGEAGQEMLDIGAEEVAGALGFAEAIAAIRDAVAGFDPEEDVPRTIVELSGGEMILMPSELGDYAAVKVVTRTPGNSARGLPTIQGSVLLTDRTTHTQLARIDGAAATNLRTPALSLAGVSGFVPARFPDGVRLCVIGAGAQALPHVRAAQAVAPVRSVVFGVRTAGRAQELTRTLTEGGVPATEAVLGEDLDAALADVDLIITATSASEPLFADSAVRADALVVAMGSHSPSERELPGALLGRSHVIVETFANARREAGDVILAIEEGHLGWEQVHTLREVVTEGEAALSDDRPVVFKTSGMSWEDVAVAGAIYEAVVQSGGAAGAGAGGGADPAGRAGTGAEDAGAGSADEAGAAGEAGAGREDVEQ
ncbi:ornithine cyclodeaminase family protein [Brevibacterium sp.]|uniref:ornithine cyclodeaminase family protein n=1 Tax=Brevibacterium sp. TaxID=1701 RepID=UPI0025BA24AA|nr:ornithine cyclodeaminase family protein [Brevibacterium sp.]